MARPKKENRIEKNGDSIKVYDCMGYAGSISIADLGLFMRRGGLHPTFVYKETVVKPIETRREFG